MVLTTNSGLETVGNGCDPGTGMQKVSQQLGFKKTSLITAYFLYSSLPQ